jgi:hypothetical protein
MKSYIPITIVILCLSFLISSLQYSNMVSEVVVQGQEEEDKPEEKKEDKPEEKKEDKPEEKKEDITTQEQQDITTQEQQDITTQEQQDENNTQEQQDENNTQEQQVENNTQLGMLSGQEVSNRMTQSSFFEDEDGQIHKPVVGQPVMISAEEGKTGVEIPVNDLPEGETGDFKQEISNSFFSEVTSASVNGQEVSIQVSQSEEGKSIITIPLEDTDGQEVVQIFGVRAPEQYTSSGNYRITYNWEPLREDLSEAILLGANEAPYALTVTFWSEETSTVISSGEFNLTIRHADLDNDGVEFTTLSNLNVTDDGSSDPLMVDFGKDTGEIPNEYDVELTLTEVDGETLVRPDDAVLQRVRVVP